MLNLFYESNGTKRFFGTANQCPLEGGDAVYQARAMLDTNLVYDDVQLCSSSSEPLVKPPLEEGSIVFHLYPNPARDYLLIELEKELETKGTLQVFNAIGLEVVRQTLAEGQVSYPVFLSDIPAGIYRMVLIAPGQNRSIKSFVIAK